MSSGAPSPGRLSTLSVDFRVGGPVFDRPTRPPPRRTRRRPTSRRRRMRAAWGTRARNDGVARLRRVGHAALRKTRLSARARRREKKRRRPRPRRRLSRSRRRCPAARSASPPRVWPSPRRLCACRCASRRSTSSSRLSARRCARRRRCRRRRRLERGPVSSASFEDRSNSALERLKLGELVLLARALLFVRALRRGRGAPRAFPRRRARTTRGARPGSSAAGRAAASSTAPRGAARFASASTATRCCLAPRLRNGRGAADDVSGVFAVIVAFVESSRGAKEGDAGVAARGSEADASDASSSASRMPCGAPGTGTSSRSNPFSFVCGSVTRDVSSFSSFSSSSKPTEAAATSASMATPSYAVAPSTSSAPSRAGPAHGDAHRVSLASPSPTPPPRGRVRSSGPRGISFFFFPDWYSPGSEGPPFCSSCSDDLRVGEGEGQTA